MSPPTGPAWTRGFGPRWASDPRPDMRISDSERAEVADRLSKHYGDGRLDQDELNERLDQAMKAKTHADLAGLLADLPGDEPPGAEPPARKPGRRNGHWLRRAGFLALVIVLAAILGHALAESFVPWLLIGFVALVWLRRGTRSRRC
jgi:hypothetical protein